MTLRGAGALRPPDVARMGNPPPRHRARVSNGKLLDRQDVPLSSVYTLDNRRLENFLERHKAYYAYSGEIEIRYTSDHAFSFAAELPPLLPMFASMLTSVVCMAGDMLP